MALSLTVTETLKNFTTIIKNAMVLGSKIMLSYCIDKLSIKYYFQSLNHGSGCKTHVSRFSLLVIDVLNVDIKGTTIQGTYAFIIKKFDHVSSADHIRYNFAFVTTQTLRSIGNYYGVLNYFREFGIIFR